MEAAWEELAHNVLVWAKEWLLPAVPRLQRQGLGRQLLQYTLAAFRTLGFPKVHLFVFTANEAAVAFYRSLGWTERHDIAVFSLDH
jgi:GNAT superfamily N-acetyltransferase